jgi:hypothetical protein
MAGRKQQLHPLVGLHLRPTAAVHVDLQVPTTQLLSAGTMDDACKFGRDVMQVTCSMLPAGAVLDNNV